MGKDLTCLGCAELETGDDGDGLDAARPPKAHIMANAIRRQRRVLAPALACIWREFRQDFAEGHVGAGGGVFVEIAKVSADKATHESSGDIVRVSLDHECKVQHAGGGQTELAELICEEHAGDDGSAAGAEATSEGNVVCHMYADTGGEGGDVVATEDIQGDPGCEVLVRVERDLGRALAGVGEGELGVAGGGWAGHGEGEIQGEREADYIEARTDVCGRRGDPDCEQVAGGHVHVASRQLLQKG